MISRADIQQLWKKGQRDLIFTQATGLAFTTVSSLVPILAVAFFLFKSFGGLESLIDQIESFIDENLAPSFSQQISVYLDKFVDNSHAGAVGVLGLLGFMFTSIMTLVTIENTFNYIWGIQQNRSWSKRVTSYWSLLTIGPLLLGVSFALSSKAITWLRNDNGFISHVLVWGYALVPYLMSGLLFTGLFIFMPNATVDRRDALKAGALTGFVFEIAKLIYAAYASYAIAHNSVYGSLAIVPLFLLWLYVIWLIVLFGAELCFYFQYQRLGIPYQFSDGERLNLFLINDIIEELGQPTDGPQGGLTILELLGKLKVPPDELMEHIHFLEEGEWVLSRPESGKKKKKIYLVVPKEKIDFRKVSELLETHRYAPRSERGKQINEQLKKLWSPAN